MVILLKVALLLTALLASPTFGVEESSEETTEPSTSTTLNSTKTNNRTRSYLRPIKSRGFLGDRGPRYLSFHNDDPNSQVEEIKPRSSARSPGIRYPRYRVMDSINEDPNSEIEIVQTPKQKPKEEDEQWKTLRQLLNSAKYPGVDEEGNRRTARPYDY